MRVTSLNCVYHLAKDDPRIIYIGSDLGTGTLNQFKKEIPDRFFMEGISEAHIIGMAAGLAKEGYIPYVNTIATFITRRCYEQIAIDLCLNNLPVRLIGNGGGLVYAPLGPTHLATDDIGLMRLLPNMTILVASDADEMKRLMMQTADVKGPIYIRVAKGGEPVVSKNDKHCEIGKAIYLREPDEVLIITTGVMVHRALLAADLLKEENIQCGILNMHTIKPLDVEAIFSSTKKIKLLVILEEHNKIGGLGNAVVDAFLDHQQNMPQIVHIGLPDSFSEHYGSQENLIDFYKMSPVEIKNKIQKKLFNVNII